MSCLRTSEPQLGTSRGPKFSPTCQKCNLSESPLAAHLSGDNLLGGGTMTALMPRYPLGMVCGAILQGHRCISCNARRAKCRSQPPPPPHSPMPPPRPRPKPGPAGDAGGGLPLPPRRHPSVPCGRGHVQHSPRPVRRRGGRAAGV